MGQVKRIRISERLATYKLGAESWGSGAESPEANDISTFETRKNHYGLLVLGASGGF